MNKLLSKFVLLVAMLATLATPFSIARASLSDDDLLLIVASLGFNEKRGVKVSVGPTTSATDTTYVNVEGGDVILPDSGVQGKSIVVKYPEGAVDNSTAVTLRIRSGSCSPNSGVFSDRVLEIESTSTQFSQPLQITIPYDPARGFPVPYYVDDNGYLNACTVTDINEIEHTITFETYHASFFTWIYASLFEEISTDFKPGDDGFSITNHGTPPLTTGGECLGMTMFSKWYFYEHGGGLYDKFRDKVSSCSDQDVIVQDIIATRAHISVHREVDRYWDSMTNATNMLKMTSVKQILSNTETPVPIIITSANAGHAVLAYGTTEDELIIYDPNHPGDVNLIKVGNETIEYGSYTNFNYLGAGTMFSVESFSDILEDANDGFSSPETAITITSHTSGQQVADRTQIIRGTIEDNQALIEKLEIYVSGTTFPAEVDSSGNFAVPITLLSGVNVLQFITYARDFQNRLVETNNNQQCGDYTLTLNNSDYAAILITLTWDKNDTDVDLYVVDPTGDYSCYYDKITSDGGELDYDDTDGYGPEHWTLTFGDTVRWDQPYRVRLHYYSDHGNGGTGYTVKIMMYENSQYELLSTFNGYLYYNDGYNDGPTDTGSDWKDIAVITPQNIFLRSAQAAFKGRRSIDRTSVPDYGVSVSVPSPDERNRVKLATPPRKESH